VLGGWQRCTQSDAAHPRGRVGNSGWLLLAPLHATFEGLVTCPEYAVDERHALPPSGFVEELFTRLMASNVAEEQVLPPSQKGGLVGRRKRSQQCPGANVKQSQPLV
jgi:hypothetical protein